jgi:hypothetical protein
MYFTVAGIYHKPFKIWLVNQNFKQLFPYTLITPADKSSMRVAPSSIVWREIAPGGSGSHNPENSVYKKSVILSNTSPTSFSSG